MLGAIFGDIVGSIYEFNNIKSTQFELIGKRSTFTDDSILTIAVADWLLMGVLNKERLIFIIKQYVKEYPNPLGGYGSRFQQWAFSSDNEPYKSWGNGSAMRVAAVGWAFDSLEETEKIAKLTAEITHNHPEGIKGAQATAAAIYMARTCSTKLEIKEYIENKYGYNLSRTCDEIRPDYSFNESCAGTVPEAIIAFLDSSDFESAIRLAVSLGGDSDTLTCITGGIAEAFYGIPESMVEKVLAYLPSNMKVVVDKFQKISLCRRSVYFEQFKYYKGERSCPFSSKDSEKVRWWDFEKSYFDNYKDNKQWSDFLEFFDDWIVRKAAPENNGYDLSKGNPWKESYYENAP
ncbi:MAG: ADP-ribosylglycohydrolase family protein [Paludibacter sp.]